MINDFIKEQIQKAAGELDLLGYEVVKKTIETGYEHGLQESGTFANREYKIIKSDKKLTEERKVLLKRVLKEFEEGKRKWDKDEIQ